MTAALLGCGRWGRNIGRCLSRLGALSAVCDEQAAAAAALSEAFSVPSLSMEAVLADASVMAVAVATPAVSHFEVAMCALAAGKHVFVEKPMAMAVDEAEQLVARAAELDRVLMVGHLLQYHPAFQALRARVAGGDIGAVRYVYSNRLSLGQIRTEENALWSFAPHDLSMILSLMGEPPDAVKAVGGAYVQAHLPDVTTTHLRFSGGRRAHVFVSWLHPYKEQRLIVIGEKGMLEFNDGQDWPAKLILYPHQVGWQGDVPTPQRAEAVPLAVAPAEPLLEEMRHFLDCARSGETPRTDGVEGLAVLRVLKAAQACLDDPEPAAA